MKPTVAADEMFPEGVGPYMDMEEVTLIDFLDIIQNDWCMIDSVFHRSAQHMAGGPSNLLMDLAANEKAVDADFFNDFEDLFDEDDLK